MNTLDGIETYIIGIIALLIIAGLSLLIHRQLVLSAIKNEKKFLNTLIDNLEEGIMACDAKGHITVMNAGMKKILGLSDREDRKLWNFNYYLPNNELPLTKQEMPLNLALKGQIITAREFVLKTASNEERNVIVNGHPIINVHKEICGAIISVRDVTQHKEMENQLIRKQTHDLLTDLPNRTLLLDRLEQAIHRAKRSNTMIALLFIDIDHFKLINENFGHAAGDELLLIISRRLQKCFRESDTICRLSGDEFVVMITNLENEEGTISLAQKMLEKLSQPFLLSHLQQGNEKQKTKITVSIGISSYPKNGTDPDTLLKNAETAMFRVKSIGWNKIQFFSEEMNLRAAKHHELVQHVHTALDKREYLLFYQPIIELATGSIVAFEVLLRWQHPTLGLLQPMDFITLIEETGLIVPIGEWVVETACMQNKEWQNMGLPPVRVAVNMSVKQINESDLFGTIKEILKKIELDPKYLELELTESSILEYPVKSLKTLSDLKEIGVSIALDDFGTGYSNLSYLSRLPVSKLKIDKTFISHLADRSEKAAIVLAILNLATRMNLTVTAEGVETYGELSFLKNNNCHEVQGFYFSKPLTAAEATSILRENPNFIEVT